MLAIVGSAPSAIDYVDELRSWPGEIWAVNGAYRFLMSHGVNANAFIGLDPLPGLKEYVEKRHPMTAFLMSSVCDPSVFDELKDADVWLWHSRGAIEPNPYPDNSVFVSGGTTCLTRAPFLAHMLGWRDITVFGADSSYDEGPYCYKHGTFKEDTTQDRIEVECNGQVFVTELLLLKQASVFGVMQTMFNGLLKFKCRGLLKAFLDSPMHELKDAA